MRGRAYKDISGLRFNRLTVMWPTGRAGKDHVVRWLCCCDCGNYLLVRVTTLNNGDTKSCGCLNSEMTSRRNREAAIHGMRNTAEYHAYCLARQRCTNPKTDGWKYYGGRGIQFRFRNFAEFYAEVGPKPTAKHSIDRIDTNGHYEAGNVKWSTAIEQRANRRPVQKIA